MTSPSEEIKSRLDIIEVIGNYIRLQKQGGNFRALCPFHNEKTPSFYVSPARQIWHCFGCSEGGDMFKFVMKMEGIEFVDALRLLAAKAGVELKKQDPALTSQKSLLQDVCKEAERFFQNNLRADEGSEGYSYLRQRGLKDETISEFKIGYAPDSWDSLCNFLSMRRFNLDAAEKAGLAIVSEKSGRKKYYDRFRGRVMFPIADANGMVIGFTGRYLKERPNEGKYVNTSQTLIFNKSFVLYGIDKTKMEIKKADLAVIVEGQMDMIMARQDGVKNIVAASGTAFTQEQLNLLKRYTKNICLLFDSDIAGDAAAQRSIALAQSAGFNVRVVMLSEAKDPADFVAESPGKLVGKINKAASVMDYYFQYAFSKFNPTILEDKKKITELLLSKIKNIQNKVEVYHWLEKLSSKLQVGISYLEEEMKKASGDFQDVLSTRRTEYQAQVENSGKAPEYPLDKFIKHLMVLIAVLEDDGARTKSVDTIKNADFYKSISIGGSSMILINPTLFNTFDLFLKSGIISRFSKDFFNRLDDAQKALVNEALFEAEIKEYPDVEKEINYCVSRAAGVIHALERKNKEFALKEAEAAGDTDRVNQLLRELNEIVKYANEKK